MSGVRISQDPPRIFRHLTSIDPHYGCSSPSDSWILFRRMLVLHGPAVASCGASRRMPCAASHAHLSRPQCAEALYDSLSGPRDALPAEGWIVGSHRLCAPVVAAGSGSCRLSRARAGETGSQPPLNDESGKPEGLPLASRACYEIQTVSSTGVLRSWSGVSSSSIQRSSSARSVCQAAYAIPAMATTITPMRM